MIDVPNQSNKAIGLMRKIFEKIFIGEIKKRKNQELDHHRAFSTKDLKQYGFKVYGCLGWMSYSRVNNRILTKTVDAYMRIFPSYAGTIIGIRSKN